MALDGVTHNSAVKASGDRGEWQLAMQLLHERLQEVLAPKVVTCSSAITAFDDGGEWQLAM